MACARLNGGGGKLEKDAIGEKTGWARDSGKGDKIEDMETVDSERSGAPNRNGGSDVIAEALDPSESDRRGAAFLRLGNVRTDMPPSFMIEEADNWCACAAFPSSLSTTMYPHETLREYFPFLNGDMVLNEEGLMIPTVLLRLRESDSSDDESS
jgi:hypothetical protein